MGEAETGEESKASRGEEERSTEDKWERLRLGKSLKPVEERRKEIQKISGRG